MRVTNLPLIFGYWTLLLGCNPAPESVSEFAPEFVLQSRPENRCAPFAPGETVVVSRVIDGDTLHLADGRRVRLIGVNTPEMGHGDEPDQALAAEAKQFVEAFVARYKTLSLVIDKEPQDRHGRTLAHIFTTDGLSLEEMLLQDGLAWHVAVPPNLALAGCLQESENRGRGSQKGVWSTRYPVPNDIAPGYRRIVGRISDIAFGKTWWLELQSEQGETLNLLIHTENQEHFLDVDFPSIMDARVEVEGWVYPSFYRGKPQLNMKLETPYAIQVFD